MHKVRFIILGAGSIGCRHLRNSIDLGHDVVAVFDPDPERIAKLKNYESSMLLTSNEEDVFEVDADAVLICSPPSSHVRQARVSVRHGLHVFVEKPLSNTLLDINELTSEALMAERVVLVGCNLRFLPSLKLVKKLMGEGRVGRPLAVRAQIGYYFPHWRPQVDYRDNYGSKQASGGGIVLDAIHEFDYLWWFFGDVEEVFCYAGKTSTLEIDVEDNADILMRFRSGIVANLHLDYLQRTYRRSCEVIGEDGVIVWDYISQSVTVYGKKDRHCEVFAENINTERNQGFLDELKHFVACIEGVDQPVVDAAGGRAVLEIALAAKVSATEGHPVKLRE